MAGWLDGLHVPAMPGVHHDLSQTGAQNRRLDCETLCTAVLRGDSAGCAFSTCYLKPLLV